MKPEVKTISGILKKVKVLTVEEHKVKKPLVILYVGTKTGIVDIVASPKYLAALYEVEEKELKEVIQKKVGKPCEFTCEYRIEGETTFTNAKGAVQTHERTGYAIQDTFAVSEMQGKVLELYGAGITDESAILRSLNRVVEEMDLSV